MEEGRLSNLNAVADNNDQDRNETDGGQLQASKEIDCDDRLEGNDEAKNAKVQVREHRPNELLTKSDAPEARKVDNPVSEVMKYPRRKPKRTKARSGKDLAKSPDDIKTEEVVEQTKGILSDLTPENFEETVRKFMQLELNDRDERIKAVVSVVYEEANDKPDFAVYCVRLLQRVCRNSVTTAKKFRKEILDRCQAQFTKLTIDVADLKRLEAELANEAEDKKETLKLELDEKRFAVSRRSSGNVRFIGELFNVQMLTAKVMVECVNMLLGSGDEDSYECLCELLATAGEALESQLRDLTHRAVTAPPNQLPKFVPEKNWMGMKFSLLKDLSGNTKLSSRIRSGILDVIKLRESGWKPERESNATKTIDARQDHGGKKIIHALPEAQRHQHTYDTDTN